MSNKNNLSSLATKKRNLVMVMAKASGAVLLLFGLIAGVELVLQPQLFNQHAQVLTYLCSSSNCADSCTKNGGICTGNLPNCSCILNTQTDCYPKTVKCMPDKQNLATCLGTKKWSLFECPYGCQNNRCNFCQPNTSWCSASYSFSCSNGGRLLQEYGLYCDKGCNYLTGKCN